MSSQQFNARANIFLMVNLGCEMLYVIDQRLKAQQISEEKSIQVIHDVTVVLLEPKFVDSLIVGSTQSNAQLLTVEHAKFMLKDIATSSLMRLDETSMDKLWNLMTMIYKWQLFVSKHQHHLLDITFRHLDTVGRLYPDAKRSMLVDFTKNKLLDFWNASADEGQMAIFRTSISWLQCFNTKISLLIRLGFQSPDGSFMHNANASYFPDFVSSIGENIYEKSVDIAAQKRGELAPYDRSATRHVDQLAELLNLQQNSGDSEDLKPIDATNFQKQFEENLQQCNILFVDLDVNGGVGVAKSDRGKASDTVPNITFPDSSTQRGNAGEFVQLDAVYNRNSDAIGTRLPSASHAGGGLNKELLDLYSKMN